MSTKGHAQTKLQKLNKARLLYLQSKSGLTDIELSEKLKVNRASAYRYRVELGCIETSVQGRYTLHVTDDDLLLAQAIIEAHSKQR